VPLPADVTVGYAANLCGAQLREFICAVHLACLISEYGASVLRSGDAAHSAAVRECLKDMRAVTAAKLCELRLMSEQQAAAVAQDWVLPLAPCDPAVWRQWEAAMSDICAPFDPTQPTVEEVFGIADGKHYVPCCAYVYLATDTVCNMMWYARSSSVEQALLRAIGVTYCSKPVIHTRAHES
jgi:hypothetical protein